MKYKQEGNECYSLICKLLMNSLYGKFATKTEEEFKCLPLKESMSKGIDITGFTPDWDRDLLYKSITKRVDKNYIIPIFSSYVTAYGRIKLHKALVKLKGKYCDTDSIFTTEQIEDSKELGELKLEKVSEETYIVKPKMYHLKGKDFVNIKMKGINKATIEDFENMLNRKEIQQQRFSKLRHSIKSNILPNTVEIYSKINDLEDNKRLWKEPFNKFSHQKSKPLFINTLKSSKRDEDIDELFSF
jgi:hypothetical protein